MLNAYNKVSDINIILIVTIHTLFYQKLFIFIYSSQIKYTLLLVIKYYLINFKITMVQSKVYNFNNLNNMNKIFNLNILKLVHLVVLKHR